MKKQTDVIVELFAKHVKIFNCFVNFLYDLLNEPFFGWNGNENAIVNSSPVQAQPKPQLKERKVNRNNKSGK